jgi:hypothetical protein
VRNHYYGLLRNFKAFKNFKVFLKWCTINEVCIYLLTELSILVSKFFFPFKIWKNVQVKVIQKLFATTFKHITDQIQIFFQALCFWWTSYSTNWSVKQNALSFRISWSFIRTKDSSLLQTTKASFNVLTLPFHQLGISSFSIQEWQIFDSTELE